MCHIFNFLDGGEYNTFIHSAQSEGVFFLFLCPKNVYSSPQKIAFTNGIYVNKKIILSLILVFFASSILEINAQYSIQEFTYHFKSSDVRKIDNKPQKILFTGDYPLSTGMHFCTRYVVSITIPLPNGAVGGWVDVNKSNVGWSGANPNNQQRFVNTGNSGGGITISTYFYETFQYNILGQQIGSKMYPIKPTDGYIVYTAVIPNKITESKARSTQSQVKEAPIEYPIESRYIGEEQKNHSLIEPEINNFSISLNSALSEIKISPTQPLEENSEVSVYTMSGALVFNKKVTNYPYVIPFNFPKGNYLVRIRNKDKVEIHKVIK